MATAWCQPALFIGWVLGIGGPVLGLTGLLLWTPAKRHMPARLFLALIPLLAGLALVAAAQEQPPGIWLPLLLLAGTLAVFSAICSPLLGWIGARLLTCLRDLRGQCVMLILACPVLAFLWACHVKDVEPVPLPHDDGPQLFLDNPAVNEVPSCQAVTDSGRPVQLLACRDEPLQLPKVFLDTEEKLSRSPEYAFQVIRVASPNWRCNCMGWVFTGGRYWINSPEDVEHILQDNGYYLVSVPQVGDLAVYRNAAGEISHVGIVRSGVEDGPILVESKWGWLGRYIHSPEAHPYPSDSCTYYHSARPGGHVLRGLGGEVLKPHPRSAAD